MNISMITVTVYFVGIAAFVNAPPNNSVTKSVIFPEADTGTYSTASTTINLLPHHTYLHVRGSYMVTDSTNTAQVICNRVGGLWVRANISTNDFCSVSLRGAKLWTVTSDTLSEDSYFRKIPSFSQYCTTAKDLPVEYTGDPDPNYVAARFDIKGGTMSACNRNYAAFVTKLTVNSGDGAVYIQQDQRTSRILLINNAFVTVENKPDAEAMAMDSTMQDYRSHFGWYYRMNTRSTAAPCEIVQPATVSGLPSCPSIPGSDDVVSGTMAASADCSNSNFP